MARQRTFDIEHAIDIATEMFWRKGYERTSLADLTKAIGITPPSFYFAFGSKEDLFRAVLARYRSSRLEYAEAATSLATARDVAEQMLLRYAELYTDPAKPPGCLAVNCSLPSGCSDALMQEEFTKQRCARRARIRERFERARAEGDLPKDADADELARYLMTVGWGMAIDAQSGATRSELTATAKRALAAWPA
ncbi:TetR/AcrR family transcriptional regulator, transcriptional repressor for nem operon [Pararobbsia alpina]|uniref:TetR/AcrR family transcriptional regulator n=1 Tax=Pararobbsia alpina TaxID=621374 RepID=UPI0039A5817C